MRITNCHISSALVFFKNRFLERWNLLDKVDNNEPLVMFGCYNADDIAIATANKTKVIIVYGGTDAMRKMNLYKLKGLKHIFHIAGSNWIANDLENAGLPYKYISVSVISDKKLQYTACPLGDKIYIYTSQFHPKVYGGEWYPLLFDVFGRDSFIITYANMFPYEQLLELYKQCFIGLRLLKHDGLSETVIELGLLGRKVVYNGYTPNALNYINVDNIIHLIKQEQQNIGKTFPEISQQMKAFIDIGDSWLNTENYV